MRFFLPQVAAVIARLQFCDIRIESTISIRHHQLMKGGKAEKHEEPVERLATKREEKSLRIAIQKKKNLNDKVVRKRREWIFRESAVARTASCWVRMWYERTARFFLLSHLRQKLSVCQKRSVGRVRQSRSRTVEKQSRFFCVKFLPSYQWSRSFSCRRISLKNKHGFNEVRCLGMCRRPRVDAGLWWGKTARTKNRKKSSAHSTAAKSEVKSRHFFHASVNLLASVSQLHISFENNNRI